MTPAQQKTASLLASLWLKNRPIIEERLATLDRAVSSAATGVLAEDLRDAAADTAHKLAGSLGMYGYGDGSIIASQLEALLHDPAPDPALLRTLTAELRHSLTEMSVAS
jgi:HPt (histidine-containing phosphotransfer) domain-containing protein